MNFHPSAFLLLYIGLDIFLTIGSFGFYNPSWTFEIKAIWKVMNVFNYNFFTSPFDFLILTVLRVLLIVSSAILTRLGKVKTLLSMVLDNDILSIAVFILAVLKTEILCDDPILRMCPGIHLNVCVTAVFNFTVAAVIRCVIINGAAYQRLQNERPDIADVENGAVAPIPAEQTPLFKQFKFIVDILWVQKELLLSTSFSVVLLSISSTIVTAVLGKTMSNISEAKDLEIILSGAVAYVLFNSLKYILELVKKILLALTKRNVSRDLQKKLFAAFLRQEIGYFDTIPPGDLATRLTEEHESISSIMPEQFCLLVENSLFLTWSIIWMSLISWHLTIVILTTLPILYKTAQIEAKYKEEISKPITEKKSESNGVIQEAASGVRLARTHAAEQQETERHGEAVDTVEDLVAKMEKFDCLFGFVWGIIWIVTTFILFVYAGYLIEQERIKSAEMLTFIFLLYTLQDAILRLATIFSKVVETIGRSYKVIQLLHRQPQFNYDEGTETPDITGNIKFENVTFSYPTRPNEDVIKELSLDIKAKTSTAIVGPSGNGKTTIVQLLQQLYRPATGRILIDGKDIKQMDHEFYHRTVGVVQQEPTLSSGTIEENIKYGMPQATEEDVLQAAEMANVTSFVEDFPDKFKTKCGSEGQQMSGGQKQRIAIARALIRNPKILILDEATSALDAESEMLFQDALDRNKQERTVIIVAHRLSTIRHADKIVYLEKGKVKEVGSHDELMAKGGLYAQLVEKQTRPTK